MRRNELNPADATVILLGTGESGKTTIFHQLADGFDAKLFNGSFTNGKKFANHIDEEDLAYVRNDYAWARPVLPNKNISVLNRKSMILTSLVLGCVALTQRCHRSNKEFRFESEDSERAAELLLSRAKEFTSQWDVDFDPTSLERGLAPDIAEAIKLIYHDRNVRAVLKEPLLKVVSSLDDYLSEWLENWNYFAEKLEEYPAWGGEGWMPSMQDMMMVYSRTTGFLKDMYKHHGKNIQYLDTGGQQAERRKWTSLFNGDEDSMNSYAVVFVVAVSDYDQVLYEDHTCNRLKDSLQCFKQVNQLISNSNVSSLTIIFNKIDLLEEKLSSKRIPLNVSGAFPKAPNTYDVSKALDWIKGEFLKRAKVPNVATYNCIAVNRKSTRQILMQCERNVLGDFDQDLTHHEVHVSDAGATNMPNLGSRLVRKVFSRLRR